VQFLEIFLVAIAVGSVICNSRAAFRAMGFVACGVIILNLGQIAGLSATGMSLYRSTILAAILLPFAIVGLGKTRLPTVAVAGITAVLVLLAGVPAVIVAGDLSLMLPMAIALAILAAARCPGVLSGGLPVLALLLGIGAGAHGTTGLARFHGQFDSSHRTRLAIETEAALTAPVKAPLGYGPGSYREAINALRDGMPALPLPHPADMKVPKDSNSQLLVTMVEGGPIAAVSLALLLLYAVSRVGPFAAESDRVPAIAAAIAALAVGALFATVLGRGIGVAAGVLIGMAGAVPTTLRATHPRPFSRRLLPPLTAAAAAVLAVGAAFAAPGANRTLASWMPLQPVAHPELTIISAEGAALSGLSITVEGEDFDKVTGGFDRMAANDVSGNKVLVLPDGSGKAIGYATYELEIPQAGAWQLTGRVFWEDGCSNSLGFEVLDQDVRISSELFNQWHELTGKRAVSLPAGKVTVRVNNIEDGVRLDWFRLSMK
jgi:hypothetical protein